MAFSVSSADLIARADERELKDLCSDTGTPASNLPSNTTLLTAIADGWGRVKAAIRIGGLYTEEAIDSLTTPSEDYLKRLVCNLAIIHLVRRRLDQKLIKSKDAFVEETEAELRALRQGQAVLDVDVNIEAGKPTIGGPSLSDYETLNLWRNRVRNSFPSRRTSLPLDRR